MTRRIVHLLAPAAFGGLESVVATLAAGQVARSDDVTIVGTFTSSPAGQPSWEAFGRIAGARTVPLVVGGRRYLAERRAVRDLLRETRPDVLHTHGYRSDVLSGPVARALGVAAVTTVHGFTGNGWKNRAYEWLQRRAYRRFDAVVAVSRRLAGELEGNGVPARIIHCLPNAWAPDEEPLSRSEARRALRLPDDAKVVGWVGRMSPEKAPDLALDVLERLDMPRAHLSFVGDGPMRSSLEGRRLRGGAEERVHWHGVVPGAGRHLRAFDALLVTSWTEGTPMVLLEAMAARVPVVTTAVGGVPDVVSDAEAVLVEPGDVAAMAEALGPILAGAPDAGERAEAALRRLAEQYAVEPWVRGYDEVYRSCLRE